MLRAQGLLSQDNLPPQPGRNSQLTHPSQDTCVGSFRTRLTTLLRTQTAISPQDGDLPAATASASAASLVRRRAACPPQAAQVLTAPQPQPPTPSPPAQCAGLRCRPSKAPSRSICLRQPRMPRPWAVGKEPLLPENALQMSSLGTFLAVQWLGLCASTAEDLGSTPGADRREQSLSDLQQLAP